MIIRRVHVPFVKSRNVKVCKTITLPACRAAKKRVELRASKEQSLPQWHNPGNGIFPKNLVSGARRCQVASAQSFPYNSQLARSTAVSSGGLCPLFLCATVES